MNPAGRPGPCCLLVEASASEQAQLGGLPGVVSVGADAVEAAAQACPDGVDAVVVGSSCASPVAMVQRVHRALPFAGVLVVPHAESGEQTRRAIAYAPGVPLDVRVVDGDAPLGSELAQLRESVALQRRHRELLASVASRPAGAPAARPRLAVEIGALLEHAPLGVLVCSADGDVLGWNRRAESLLPVDSTAADESLDALLPGAADVVRRAGADPRAAVDVAPLLLTAPDGGEVEVSAVSSRLQDGRAVVLLLLIDVSERRAAERARDRLAGHVALLSRVSESLTSTLDTAEALDRLAAALVPDLADWVSIQLADETGGFGVVTMRHRDGALADVVEQARQRQAVAASEAAPSRRVARSNEALLLPDIDDEELARLVPDDSLRALLQRLGVGSAAAVPLPSREGGLGSLVLVNQPHSRPLSQTDLDVAREVGRRAGVALDNARLYAQQRDLAGELQRSLLTAPPQPHHGEVVVRYVAAAREAQVGGDWYDALVQADGATMLVIGDVVGHDTRAAAGMSQLRGVLRGIAYTTGADPADVLTRVDAAIEGLAIETTATAVVARVQQDAADGGASLTWSNAGHPPPVVIGADGRVTVLDPVGPDGAPGEADLLLGIDPTSPRSTTRTPLGEGATVLLYTDGLVERRGRSLDEGIDALVQVLTDCSALPLDDLCDAALHRLLPEAPEDDIALVAVRLHPRPPAP